MITDVIQCPRGVEHVYYAVHMVVEMARHILRSSLQIPDAPSWRSAPGYSGLLAAALTRAYRELGRARSDPDAYRLAHFSVFPFRDRPASLQQRMHIEFVLAQAYASEDDFGLAASSVDRAMDIAYDLNDRAAQIELSFLRASLSDALLQLEEASDHYATGLRILRQLGDGKQPSDPSFEVDLLIRMAAMSYEMARYDDALMRLEDAHRMRTLWLPSATVEAAFIAWLGAQVMRSNGELNDALTTAMMASDLLQDGKSPGSLARIQGIVAEIALDRAETFTLPGPTSGREAFVRQAVPFARRAAALAHDMGDLMGEQLARLALIRASRLRGEPHNRIPALERILRRAKKAGDAALHGKTLAAIGDEYLEQGEREPARDTYMRAWRILEEFDLRAMAARPRRAFFQIGEMEVE